MDQMAKGLLFGAAVLSQTAAGCFPAAAASIDQVRIRLAAEEFDEMGMPVLEAESRVSIAIRFASTPIIRCRSAHLVEVRSNSRLPPVSTMRRAPAMPHSVSSLPPF